MTKKKMYSVKVDMTFDLLIHAESEDEAMEIAQDGGSWYPDREDPNICDIGEIHDIDLGDPELTREACPQCGKEYDVYPRRQPVCQDCILGIGR